MVDGSLSGICSEVSCGARAISGFWSGGGAWNYCMGQDAVAQPGTKIFGGDVSVARQVDNPQPEPRADGNVKQKSRCVELPTANETGYSGSSNPSSSEIAFTARKGMPC